MTDYFSGSFGGAAVEYVSCEPTENLKELFPEEYGEDDDSFEEEETERA